MQAILNKIQTIKDYLVKTNFEREEIVTGLLVAIIARQNLLMIGLPGVNKSTTVRQLMKFCLNGGCSMFYKDFSKGSTPAEIVGNFSLPAMEKERFYRVTKGYLPEAHFALADEIFKANDVALEPLLPLANAGERVFRQEGAEVQTPLISIFGTSNEYPNDGEDLGGNALYDRFLLRYEVQPLQERENRRKMLKLPHSDSHIVDQQKASNRMAQMGIPQPTPISLAELRQLQDIRAFGTQVPSDVEETTLDLWEEIEKADLRVSPRRYHQGLSAVTANAVLNGRTTVDANDLLILRHCLWTYPEEQREIASIVRKFAVDSVAAFIEDALKEALEIKENAIKVASSEAGTEADSKMKKLAAKLKEISAKNPSKSTEVETALGQMRMYRQEFLKVCLGFEAAF